MGIRGICARIAVVLVLAASGVVAFATIAPDPREAELLLAASSSTEPMPIRAEHILASPLSYIREERFQRGDTVAGFLARLGIIEVDGARLGKLRALQQLRPGHLVR